MAIKSLLDNWDGRLYRGDNAFTYDRLELGVINGAWRFGLSKRYDYFYQFSPDTAYLKHRSENGLELVEGEELDLYLSANSLISKAITLAYKKKYDSIIVEYGMNYLQAKEIIDGYISGNASVTAQDDYDLDFQVDYYYWQDQLFDREVEQPTGEGFSFDIDLKWKVSPIFDFHLNVHDLYSRIYWEDAPRTSATGSNDIKTVDESGYVTFNPIISGLETNQDYNQQLKRKILLDGKYDLGEDYVLLNIHDVEVMRFYSIGYGFKLNSAEFLKLNYNLSVSAIHIGYFNSWFSIDLVSDDLDLEKARTFGLNLTIKAFF